MNRIKTGILGIILLPLASLGNDLPLEGYWEEYGGEELPYILEYENIDAKNPPAQTLGFNLTDIPLDSFYTSSLYGKSFPAGREEFGIEDIRLTIRGSGEDCDRQMLRGRTKIGGGIRIEIIAERDAGEKWDDYNAYNLMYSKNRFRAVLGSYSAGFAEGLVLWRGFDWGAYAEKPVAPFKSDFLRGYSSTGENGALFGGGTWYQNRFLSLILIYSDSRWDASADENGITSLNSSGIHVSPSELDNKDRLRERLYAARLKIKPRAGISLGLSSSRSFYSPPFASKDSVKYTFDFVGEENTILGTDCSLENKTFKASGEFAGAESGGTALVGRLLMRLERVKMELSGRFCSRDFKNLRSIFPDGNENGFTCGLSLKTLPEGIINAFFDSWNRPWRTSTCEMPPEGYKASLHIGQMYKDYYFSLRLRRTTTNPELDGLTRDQIRFSLEKRFARLTGKFRLERMQSLSDEGSYNGYLLSGGLEAPVPAGRLNFTLSGFQVPDYECRIYQYESDVPGIMLTPFYLGRGIKTNLLYDFSISRSVRLALKAAVTAYASRPGGLSEKSDTRFTVYLNYHFTADKGEMSTKNTGNSDE